MLKQMKKTLIVIPFILLLFNCDHSNEKNSSGSAPTGKTSQSWITVEETFNEEDRPGLEYNSTEDYFLVKPWNYEKDYNADRKYPLVIYLHDAYRTKYLKNLYYIGMGYYNWNDSIQNMTSEYNKSAADDFRKTYACFTFVPQEQNKTWDNAKLISQIEYLKSTYRIDENRIYIHGFEIGGNAVYTLATDYYNYNKQLFAGIIRLNGDEPGISLPDEVVQKTSIWLMVGLTTDSGTVDAVNNSYNFLKNHSINSGSTETVLESYIITNGKYSHNTNIYTLKRNEIEVVKKTEFTNNGYSISGIPFYDSMTLEWLFSQTLENYSDSDKEELPSITTQPKNTTVISGETAKFTVSATGSGELSYQWKKNGINIPDAVESSLKIVDTSSSESGTVYNVNITNSAGSIISETAELKVIEEETFNDENRPNLEYNSDDDYFFLKPWNYEKDYNTERKYPLVIYLHGADQEKYLKNLYYMGIGYYSWDESIQNMTSEHNITISDNFRKKYPCFIFVPQEHGKSWDNAKLISQIENLKKLYPQIDTNRIYLHGFSIGGVSTFTLANDYYDYNSQLFAGIIRLTGTGNYDTLKDEIIKKTSIWVMVGLNGEYTYSIYGIRNAYNFLKNHVNNTEAVETYKYHYYITKRTYQYLANTVTLTKDGIEVAKKTEFPNEGHYITEFPFCDPTAMEWLFSQSLENR